MWRLINAVRLSSRPFLACRSFRRFPCNTRALAGSRSFTCSLLRRTGAAARRRCLAGALLASRLRMDAEFVPRRLRYVDPVVACRLFDVGKRQLASGVGDAGHLIESGHRVANVTCVGQRLFALFRERIHAIGEVTLCGQPPVLFVRFPSCSHGVMVPKLV